MWLRNLQEQVKKTFCYQKLFSPFTVRRNCSSDLKIFANSRPSASNFNFFSWSLEHFFLTVGQNNFGNKIPFLKVWFFLVQMFPVQCNVRLCQDLLRYGQNTEMVKYEVGAWTQKPLPLLRPTIFLKKLSAWFNLIFLIHRKLLNSSCTFSELYSKQPNYVCNLTEKCNFMEYSDHFFRGPWVVLLRCQQKQQINC